MLHENPRMTDIDVAHWRNLQALLLESAKEKRRIVILHDNGDIQKVAHTDGNVTPACPISCVTSPAADAKAVYEANSETTDFVMMLERTASDDYFRRVQDAWTVQDDIDEYVHRAFSLMDGYPDGIVTYPGPASQQLGLQWRLGVSYAELKAAVEGFVPPDSTVVFGLFEGEALWASLILCFDADRRISVVTTVDPADLTASGGREVVAKDVVAWTEQRFPPVSIALFADTGDAKRFLDSTDKVRVVRDLYKAGKLLADPVPEPLARVLTGD